MYYQWVPFVLGLQCVLFYLPRVIWQIICYNQTGTDLCHLVALASEAIRAKADKRLEIVDQLAWSVEQLLFQVSAFVQHVVRLLVVTFERQLIPPPPFAFLKLLGVLHSSNRDGARFIWA